MGCYWHLVVSVSAAKLLRLSPHQLGVVASSRRKPGKQIFLTQIINIFIPNLHEGVDMGGGEAGGDDLVVPAQGGLAWDLGHQLNTVRFWIENPRKINKRFHITSPEVTIRSVPDLLVGVLVAAAVQVEVLPHPGPVRLLAAGVVLELALVRPPPQ